ncbi:MAG: WXG100 family type VII secretion target [Microbacterium sp.]|uniref:WXG100 family type VII secretion target n=1 Tax=Microbacterium sp. TaxID=51671 RepID=UPI003F962374
MSFNVNLPQFEAANMSLNGACQEVEQILQNIFDTIRPMGEAQWGQSLPAWGELQQRWNAEYAEVQQAGVNIKNAAIRVRDEFQQGDARGAAIFS